VKSVSALAALAAAVITVVRPVGGVAAKSMAPGGVDRRGA